MALSAVLHAFNQLKDLLSDRLTKRYANLVPVTTSEMRHTGVEAIGFGNDILLQVLEA
jgi:hypothetical protein